MIYEPEKLKNKKAMYEKRDKWIIRFAFLFWTVLLLICVNLALPYAKSTVRFWSVVVGGIIIVTLLYFFIVFLALMRRGHQFRTMNNTIVREYHEDKDGKRFLERLLAIDKAPKDMNDEMTWYLNIATAFSVSGRRKECIDLYKQLEEVATGQEKEYIQKSIKFVQEQLEKS